MSDEQLTPTEAIQTHAKGAGTIALADIYVGDRARTVTQEDLRYISQELAPSIAERGLIHPITVTWNDEKQKFQLIAGWNRLQAFKLLGHAEIPYALREAMSDEELLRLELEENIRRNPMRWQDKVVGVYRVHTYETEKANLAHRNWTMRSTGKILGVTAAAVSNILPVAKALLDKDKEIMACDSFTTAFKLLASRKEAEAMRLLHARAQSQQAPAGTTVAPLPLNKSKTEKNVLERVKESASGVLGDGMDEMEILPSAARILQAQKPASEVVVFANEINLSEKCLHVDCIEWMKQAPANSFDVIYSDPPFGIEMSMLEDVKNIDVVRDSHDVEENLDLLERFFPAAFRVLKDDSYCFIWYDIVHQEKMTKWATKAGFKVQNWPLLWLKPPGEAKNQAAHCNATKACEYIMVLRKGEAVFRKPLSTNWWVASVKGERSQQLNPFLKPFSISREILTSVGMPGMKVLDCFAGGGSISRAAINLGYDVTSLEKDPKQFPLLFESLRETYKEIIGPSAQIL